MDHTLNKGQHDSQTSAVKRLAVCIVLGSATTGAVAWGSAIFTHLDFSPPRGSIDWSKGFGLKNSWSYWLISGPGAVRIQRTPTSPEYMPSPEPIQATMFIIAPGPHTSPGMQVPSEML